MNEQGIKVAFVQTVVLAVIRLPILITIHAYDLACPKLIVFD